MSYGIGEFGSSYYGGKNPLFQVVSATAINSFTIVVTFTEPPDPFSSETTNPANYFIEVVGGSPIGAPDLVLLDPDTHSVRLITSALSYIQYKVSVTESVETPGGQGVDPQANSAEFTGFETTPAGDNVLGFRARAIRADGIHLTFLQPMLVDANFLNPLNYTVREVSGQPVPILSVTPNLPSNATRAVLNLGNPMRSSVPHTVTISPVVHTADGRSIVPPMDSVVWVKRPLRTKVAFSSFTGEVRAPKGQRVDVAETLGLQETFSSVTQPYFGSTMEESLNFVEDVTVVTSVDPTVLRSTTSGNSFIRYQAISRGPLDTRSSIDSTLVETLQLHESLEILPKAPASGLDPSIAELFGAPDGLVFFSPALVTGGAPLSSIQVDEVKTCTTAYDSYKFPQPIDPKPFYAFSPLTNTSFLNDGGTALFTDFYRLGEARHSLHDRPSDLMPAASDVGASIVLKEIWPPARAALLNNPAWTMFDNVGSPPPYDFILADNLSPFPAPTVGNAHHYINPSETIVFVEELGASHAVLQGVAETIERVDNFDLDPGDNMVQVNVNETITAGESVETHIGINLFETVVTSEGLSVTT